MLKFIYQLFYIACVFIACYLPSMAIGQVAVIVNQKNEVFLAAPQISNIFLGKSKVFQDGTNVQAVDQSESSPLREIFYTKITNKTSAQIKAIWSRLLFTGGGTPPIELKNSSEVKKFVATHVDAIGYIDKTSVDGSVKVILSID